MKKTILICCILITISCKNSNKDIANLATEETIEIYDFEKLEPLLHLNDDTIYVINFWATWCAPCIKEMPYFQELHDTYGHKNLKVILVSLDFPNAIESKLIPFIQKHQLTPEVVLLDDPNENFWISKVHKDWTGSIPATLIFHNSERSFFEQSFTRASLFAEVEKFIKI